MDFWNVGVPPGHFTELSGIFVGGKVVIISCVCVLFGLFIPLLKSFNSFLSNR